MNRYIRTALSLAAALAWACAAAAEAPPKPAKKPLDHAAYDVWNTITASSISPDGKWVLYTVKPGKGDAVTHVRPTGAGPVYSAKRAASARFTRDSRYVIYLVQPEEEVVKKARAAKKPDEALPKSRLEILELDTGKKVTVPRVQSFRLPEKAAGWVAYLRERPVPPRREQAPMPREAEDDQAPAKPAPKPRLGEKEKKSRGRDRKPGSELVLRNLKTGAEFRYPDVVSYAFSRNGKRLALATSAEKAEDDGVFVVGVGKGERRQVVGGRGEYRSLAWDDSGNRLAFLTDRDDPKGERPSWAVYCWKAGEAEAKRVAAEKTPGVPEGWQVAPGRAPSFSKNGRRLFFGTAPKPEPVPKKGGGGEPAVKVDVWHWKDPLLQPMQLVRARDASGRSYLAVAHLDTGKVVQLAGEDLPSVAVGSEGNARFAAANTNKPYEMLLSWDYPQYNDIYLVDVTTGGRRKVRSNVPGSASLSPGSKYLYWYDGLEQAWFAAPVRGGAREPVNLTRLIPHPVHNELHDQPSPAAPYGVAGWVKGDKALLVYDKHDVWAVDPRGELPPACVTDGAGRAGGLRFRRVRLDPEERAIDPERPMLLSAFHLTTKATGFYRDRVHGTDKPQKLVLLNESLGRPEKAEAADRLLFTRSTFRKFPDLWVSDGDFKGMARVSDANPQQKDYLWGTAELVEWNSLDGERLQGILYRPEGFDPKKKYPMLVYFYERLSDTLHRHFVPAPGSSSINISFYVSRGYVVFVPDIPYRVGHPGQSCLNAVLPGVMKLVNEGFVDKARVGVQGHSWGGYQVAYLLTRTSLFAAAEAGAPVSNMTSAYGGIRWGTGMSRMFQYEKTQSRIGGTLWDAQQRYIENSPVFWADRVETPLLLMHNDQDGAVPWYQGIEMFVALRRLGKPCWLVNYNGADHGLRRDEDKRDWAVRMQQFFDHYLKGAPPPVWLADGIPAEKKGRTLGLDLVKPDKNSKN